MTRQIPRARFTGISCVRGHLRSFVWTYSWLQGELPLLAIEWERVCWHLYHVPRTC
jgi:hypothetical protein